MSSPERPLSRLRERGPYLATGFKLTPLLLLTAEASPITVAPPASPTGAALERALDDLVAAYPEQLARRDGLTIVWRDGTRTPAGRPAASAQAAIDAPSLADIFAWAYPPGATPKGVLGDPGRARPAAFFRKMYGDCAAGEVERRLVPVRWVGGHRLRFTRTNGAAAALERVARDLDALGPAYGQHLWPTSGTYNCRAVAGTASPSMHGFGAAIDLAARYGSYWRWGPRKPADQSVPGPIIAAFERHGFIWGGKWAHYDSFHFEYRPELIRAARR